MVKNLNVINLLCSIATPKIDKLFRFNQVVAWNLREAFKKRGYEGRFIYADAKSWRRLEVPSKADHTIAISGASMLLLRGTGRQGRKYSAEIQKECKKYREKIRKSTTGKITMYIDADYGGWGGYFDHVFTLVKPLPRSSKKYVYAGWGADPKYYYPQQAGPALPRSIFLDCLMYGYYKGKYDKIYDTYKQVLSASKINVHNPLADYLKTRRIPWPEMQKILRKCHFYACTQLGEGGLTRIEAATCGAMLVIPRPFYRSRSMGSLEHRIWDTKADLVKILKTKTNPKAIRKKALEHSWDKVASRILKTLYA